MSEELIRRFEFGLSTSDCHPGADWYCMFIRLHDDISDALPYLNADLERPTDYRHDDRILLWEYRNKRYAFRSNEIAIAPVLDKEEAQKLTEHIVETVNTIWKRRSSITPNFEGKKPLPNVIDIYKLLPRTNCRECGFMTCMAFAAELRSDPSKSSLCRYLDCDSIKLLSDKE